VRDSSGNIDSRDLNLSLPLMAQIFEPIDAFSASSASAFNKLTARVYSDLDTLYDSALHLEQTDIQALEADLAKLQSIERRVRTLTSEVNRLLLLTGETEGLLSIVGDDFSSMEKVDQGRTTAQVDIEGGVVYSSNVESSATGYDFSSLGREDITVQLQGRRGILSNTIQQTDRRNIGTASNQPWTFSVGATDGEEPTGVEVIIDCLKLGRPRITATKIDFDPFIIANSTIILAQYSDELGVWTDLPVEEPLRTIAGPTSYIFKETSFRYLRFLLIKHVYDRSINGNYFYDFGIRRIKIDNFKTNFLEESVLVSKQLFPKGPDGNNIKFTSATLSNICREIPEDTAIDFSIAFLLPSGNGYTESAFQPVSALNDVAPTYPLVAQIAGLSDDSTACTAKADNTVSFTSSVDEENLLLYGTDGEPVSLGADISKLRVWRNIGNRNRLRSIRQPDGFIVEEGWHFDGSHYSTYIEISQTDGTLIDFGPELEIDGERVSGMVRLTEGVHHMRVADENWLSLGGISDITLFDETTSIFTADKREVWSGDGLGDEANAETAASFQVHDPLYPYNQKILVEGLTFKSSYEGDKAYGRKGRYAAYLMDRVSPFDLDTNTRQTDYKKFAIIPARKGVADITNAVVLKIDPSLKERSDDADTWVPRENFEVTRQITSQTFAEGIVFRALLRTDNEKRCPSVDGYEIKVAE
jgi:hypothetical protein